MTINVGREHMIRLSEAAKIIAKKLKLKRPPNPSTLWRWVRDGLIDGVKIGGVIYTSKESIDRFFRESCSGPRTEARYIVDEGSTSTAIRRTSTATRRKQIEAAKRNTLCMIKKKG